MKFAVTYVCVTHLTRRRAGKSKIEVVSTDEPLFEGVLHFDEGFRPSVVERIFQAARRSEHSEVKVIDVRQVSERSSGDRLHAFKHGLCVRCKKLWSKDAEVEICSATHQEGC